MRVYARGAVRFRYPLLAVWAGLVTVPLALRFRGGGDYSFLAAAGRIITGGTVTVVNGGIGHPVHGALSLYVVQPSVQLGPPALILLGILQNVTSYHHAVAVAIVVACGVLSVWTVESTAVHLGLDAAVAARRALAGGAIALTGWAWIVEEMHIEDALAIAAIFAAVSVIAARRPWWVPSLLLGFAVACKPWAVIAVPVLLGLDRHRLKAAGLAVASAAAWWLPFVIAYPHTVTALSGFHGGVTGGSVLYAFGITTEPTGIRVLELGSGIMFGLVAAWQRRRLAVPLAAFAGRMLFDPRFFHYYAAGPLVAALLWDMRSRRHLPLWTCVVALAQLASTELPPSRVVGFTQLGLALTILTSVGLRRSHGGPSLLRGAEVVEPDGAGARQLACAELD